MYSVLLFSCISLSVLSSANGWFFYGSSGRQEAQGMISQECIRKAQAGDCQFYVCFDQRHACESNNYALSYGWRFCDKINNVMDKLTDEAKTWINGTRVCSMTKMLEYYRESHINCHDVESEMKEKHAECEAEHGVCDDDMLMANKDVLLEVYTVNRKMLVRFMGMLSECGLSTAGDFLSWMKDQSKTVIAFFRSIPDRFFALEDEIQQIRDSLPEISLPDIDMPDIGFPKLERLPETSDQD